MFVLRKILNGRINVSEPISMASGVSASTTFTEGEAVYYNASGVLTKANGDVTADFVVASTTTCAKAADEVPLLLVTKEMLFDVEMASAVAVGKKYKFASTGDGITTEAASTGFGAYVMRYDGKTATVRLA